MKRKRVPGMIHANEEALVGAEMKCGRAENNTPAKRASGLLVENTNNNGGNHNNNSNVIIITAATLLHLSPCGTILFLPFLGFPKSEQGIMQRAGRGSALCDLYSAQINEAFITPVLTLLTLSSPSTQGWFHLRLSKPLNSSGTRDSKGNDLDTHTHTGFPLTTQEAGSSTPIPDKGHLPPWN